MLGSVPLLKTLRELIVTGGYGTPP